MNNFSSSRHNIDLYFIAGETISALSPVFIALNTSSLTGGRVYQTDSNRYEKSADAWFAGVAITNATAGNSVRVRCLGLVSGYSSLTPGRLVYAGPAGTITQSNYVNYLLYIGTVYSSTSVFVYPHTLDIGSPAVSIGFIAGGTTYVAAVSTCNQLLFSTDVTSALTSVNLTTARISAGALTDASSSGYICGGFTYYTGGALSTTEKLSFNPASISAVGTAALSTARGALGAISDVADGKGFLAGGNTGAVYYAGEYTTADVLVYSTNVTSVQTTANLSQARDSIASLVNSTGGVGYYAGGSTAGYSTAGVTTCDKLTFSTSTTAAYTTAKLLVNESGGAGVSDNTDGKGYVASGESNKGDYVSAIATEKLTFSSETFATATTANLSQNRGEAAGITDNQDGKGYYCGGHTSFFYDPVKTSDKLTFSTDTAVAQTTANLTYNSRSPAGVSTNSA